MEEIDVNELAQRLRHEKLLIIDVREPIEFNTFNIGGENIPLGQLASALNSLTAYQEKEIILVCQHGIRSKTAESLLRSAGFKKVRNLAGGLLSWRRKISSE